MSEGSIKDALESVGIKAHIVIAGFAGALAAITQIQGLTKRQTLGVAFTSLAFTTFVTPALMQWWNVVSLAYTCGAAFTLGLCAMRIIPLVMQAVPAVWKFMLSKFTNGAIQPTQGDGGDNK